MTQAQIAAGAAILRQAQPWRIDDGHFERLAKAVYGAMVAAERQLELFGGKRK